MDLRWCYYTNARPLWNEPRPDYVAQMWQGNRALISRRKGVANPEGVPFFSTSSIGYQHSMNTDAYFIPLRLKAVEKNAKDNRQRRLLKADARGVGEPTANLSKSARGYLHSLLMNHLDTSESEASAI
jgi:hypothetical protein